MYTLTGINTTTKNSKQVITNRIPNSSKLQRTSSSGVTLKTPQQREILSKNGNKGLSNIFFGSHEYQKTHNEKIGVQKDFKKEYDELMTVSDPEEKNSGLKRLFAQTNESDLEDQSITLESLLVNPDQTEMARIALDAFLEIDSSNNPNLFKQQCKVILVATQRKIMNKDDKKILTKLFTPSNDVLEEQTNSLQDLLEDSTPKIMSFSDLWQEHPKTDVAKIALNAFLGTEPTNNLNLFKKQCKVTAVGAQHDLINNDNKEILTILFTPNDDSDVLEVQKNSLQDLLKIPFQNIMPRIALEAFLGEGPSNNLNLLKKQYEVIEIAAQHGKINEDDKEILTKFYTPIDDPDVLEVQNKSLINLVVNDSSKGVIGIALDAFLGEEPSNNLNLFKKQCEVTIVASQYIQNNNNNAKEPAFVQIETQSLLEKLKKYNDMIHNRFTPTGESDLEELSTTVQNLLVNSNQTEIARIALKALEAFLEPRNIPNLLKKQCEIIPVAVECGLLDEDDKEEIITFLFTPSDDKGILKEQSKTLQNLLKDSSQREIAKIALKAFLEKVPTNNPKLRRKQQKAVLVAIQNGIINRNNKNIMNKFFPSVMTKFIAKSIIKVGSATKTIARIWN